MIDLSEEKLINAFAIIVDINSFTRMVSESDGNLIATFIADVLYGGVNAVENSNGQVLGFMGDAFFGILPDTDSVFNACVSIAKDLDQQCEYISTNQEDEILLWPFAQGGPGLKVGIEYGWIDKTVIRSKALGAQPLLIGPPINYASRIITKGVGNRIFYGPNAAKNGLKDFQSTGPFNVKGKNGEDDYTYYKLDMSNIWVEGERSEGQDSYWG